MRKISNYKNYNTGNSTKKNYGCMIIFMIFIAIMIWFFLFSNFFVIKQITVEGLNKKENQEIKNSIISKTQGKNLFSFSSTKTEKSIEEQYSNIAKVKVYKSPPDLLKIVIVQRNASLVWQSKNQKYIIDNFGVVYKEYEESAKDLPVIIDERNDSVEIGKKILTSNFLKFIDGIQQNFEKDLNLQIEKIVIKDSVFEILVFSKTGMYMIFDTTANLDKQILDAKKALEIIKNKKLEYLDLRVPGKVYYK